jgi:hypothetical protein
LASRLADRPIDGEKRCRSAAAADRSAAATKLGRAGLSADERAERLPQTQSRPGAHEVDGQLAHPALQRAGLASSQHVLLDMALHQCDGVIEVGGGQRVADGVVGEVGVGVPGCGGGVQLANAPGVCPPQPRTQQIGEQVVVPPPRAVVVEWD